MRRRFSLTVEDAIELIHPAGGKAVLAHPGLYSKVCDLEDAVRRMTEAGLDRLEVFYPYDSEPGVARPMSLSPVSPGSRNGAAHLDPTLMVHVDVDPRLVLEPHLEHGPGALDSKQTGIELLEILHGGPSPMAVARG